MCTTTTRNKTFHLLTWTGQVIELKKQLLFRLVWRIFGDDLNFDFVLNIRNYKLEAKQDKVYNRPWDILF